MESLVTDDMDGVTPDRVGGHPLRGAGQAMDLAEASGCSEVGNGADCVLTFHRRDWQAFSLGGAMPLGNAELASLLNRTVGAGRWRVRVRLTLLSFERRES